MTTFAGLSQRAADVRPQALLVTGIVLATLGDAIASTALPFGRGDIVGDIHATPDEFAWLEVAYVACKLIGFAFAPWLLARVAPHTVLVTATLGIGLACAAAVVSPLEALVLLRAVQGVAGAVLLVSGQAILFWSFPPSRQPVVQAVFAIGAVVAPATLAPALEGWLSDAHSWTWIFFGVLPVTLASAGIVLMAGVTPLPRLQRRALDLPGLVLLCVALSSATYFLSQGTRWDWFEASRMRWTAVVAAGGFILFTLRQGRTAVPLLSLAVFKVDDFSFAFVISFVAGAALFGSAFLVPSFAISVLGLTPTDAGWLLLPSGGVFAVTMLLAAWLIQVRRVPPIATVPIGILATMAAMWMLSGSNLESGASDLMVPLLLRGLGLGCLFLSITLIAFGGLDPARLAFGIGIFSIGRQLGGLIGVAGLQSLIEHERAGNQAALGAALGPGDPAVAERLSAQAAYLVEGGMAWSEASKAATAQLGRALTGQATVIAFDTAFAALALFFVFAVPVIVGVKIGISRKGAARGARGGNMGAST